MTNLEKYNNVFTATFNVSSADLSDLCYQDIAAWDSVGHMNLIFALEEAFNISLDPDDIIEFKSYKDGLKILTKETYGVVFDE